MGDFSIDRRAVTLGLLSLAGCATAPAPSEQVRFSGNGVHGWCTLPFREVAETFSARLTSGLETGASFCLYHRGEAVLDMWGGIADPATERPWEADTASLLMSSTKALAYACIALLRERGRIDLDAPVASYWPAFGAQGKSGITVRQLLAHQGGVPLIDTPVSYEDVLAWDPLAAALANQALLWEPGTRHGYHPVTTGWIISEVVRWVDGRSARQFFDEEFARPLGLNLSIGNLDPARNFAPLLPPPPEMPPGWERFYAAMADPGSMAFRAFTNPNYGTYGINDAEVLRLEIPSGNGVGDARSLARFYASLIGKVDGVQLLSRETIEDFRSPQVSGDDAVILIRTDFGTGFFLPGGPIFANSRPTSFGHGGAGGSLGFADPEHELAFGFVMNHMAPGLGATEKTVDLVNRAYASVDPLRSLAG